MCHHLQEKLPIKAICKNNVWNSFKKVKDYLEWQFTKQIRMGYLQKRCLKQNFENLKKMIHNEIFNMIHSEEKCGIHIVYFI